MNEWSKEWILILPLYPTEEKIIFLESKKPLSYLKSPEMDEIISESIIESSNSILPAIFSSKYGLSILMLPERILFSIRKRKKFKKIE